VTELPNSFDFRGCHFYQSDDDRQTFYYLPGEPTPERSPSGEPTLTFLVTDQSALLQLATRWEVENSVIDSVPIEIRNRFPDIDPGQVRFSPAPVSIESVSLMLTTGDEAEKALATTTSSGFPPYAALFNVTLTPAQKAQVASALNGRKGLLKVVYKSSLTLGVSAEASIMADVETDIAELGPNATLADCQARIEAGINDGRLKFKRSSSAAAPDALKDKADRLAKEKAADILFQFSQKGLKPDVADLEAKVVVRDTVSLPLTSSTDLGSWYARGADSPNILIAPSPSNATAAGRPAAVMVSIGFDMKDVPVAFVQVTWDEQASIAPPVFGPVTVKGKTDKQILINTSYTNGGSPYRTQHAAPPTNELKLTPADLGLALITTDANALRHEGATQAQIRVNYRPSAGGVADEHLIRLRFGEWVDSWYVVSRSSSLGGTLEVECTQTNADGVVIKHPTITTDKVKVILSAPALNR
jgi:hypothetical protein